MPKFSFTSPEGEEYELEGPEGSTREQAFSILQEGIKSGYYKPKVKQPVKKNLLADFGTGVVEGGKGTLAALGDIASGVVKIPASVLLSVGGKLASPSTPLQTTWEAAQAAMEETFPSFGRDLQENLGYKTPMYPLQKYGEGLEYAAEKASLGNKDVQGALNIAGQLAPIPFVRPAIKGAKAAIEKIDPGLKKTATPPQTSPELSAKMAELKARKEAESKVTPVSEFEQAARELAESRYRNDQTVARLEAAIEKQNPEQPLMHADAEGNVWTKDNQLVQDKINELQFNRDKQQAAQMLLEERQRALEEQVRQQQQLDFNAAERARQEAASTGLAQHQDMLRQQSEQRIPGDNTPLEFTKEVPPHGLQEAPYQYEGALDFGPFAAEQQALPIEKQIQQGEAWRQRAIERQAEQDAVAKQEQRIQELEDTLMPLEEQLREQQYTPDLQGQGPKTRAALTAGPRRKQGGGIDPQVFKDLGKLASGVKRLVSPKQKPDTLRTPRSIENIEAKQLRQAKARAIGSDVYDSVTTLEEALHNPGKDTSSNTQEAGAGVGGMVRRNPTNKPLKYVRTLLEEATSEMNAFIKEYVTQKDTSFNGTYAKLNKQEKIDAFHLKKWLSENEVDYTPELGKELGLSPAVQKHMEARQKAYEELARLWGDMNLTKGLEPFEPRKGYFPSIFDGNFKALVGKYVTDKDGVAHFTISDVISVKSRKEFNDALKYHEGKEIIKLGNNGRMPMRQETGSRFKQRDDVMKLLTALAENDPRFADIKQQLGTENAIGNKGFMGFGVHELEKKGVGGFKGEKPWLSEAENMKEALEAEIQYFDQAAKYVSSQRLLDGTHELVTALQERGDMPNTTKDISKYLDHLTGNSLQPTAAAINQIVDAGTNFVGKVGNAVGLKVPENPRGALSAVGTAMNAMLMNIVNIPMAVTQTLQLYASGTPEAVRIQQQYGMSPEAFASSMARGHIYRLLIPALDKVGLLDKTNFPSHMVEAYQWLKKHGMEDFNEVMLSQDILQSDVTRKVKQTAFWPTVLPEKFTRPTMFMWMADMFHHAGFDNAEAIRRAKYATDYSMTDYRPEEAPTMYNRLGVLSPETSALQRYKHNALDQLVSRLQESPEHKAALLTYLGLTIALGGLVGLPMMQELDEVLIKPITKELGKERSARELLMIALPTEAIDGLASAYYGMDIGSRFSLADVAPNSFLEGIAGARLSKVRKIGEAAYEAGWKYQDEQSFKQLGKELTPSGLVQLYNEAFMANDKGQLLDKQGRIGTGVKRGEFPSKYAITNFRPLEEKVTSELNYTKNTRILEREKKVADASSRMKTALLNSDKAGFTKWYNQYKDNGGNLENLGTIVEDAYKKGFLTEKQRMEGTPGNSSMSIRRYQEMQK